MSIGRVLHVLVCLAGFLAALCVANRPRFWWQELFCTAGLYWFAPAILALLYLGCSLSGRSDSSGILRTRRAAHYWLLIGAICCYGYVTVHMGIIMAPYLYYGSWSATREVLGPELGFLWLEGRSESDRVEDLSKLLARTTPTVVIMSGYGDLDSQRLSDLRDYPYLQRTASQERGGITLFSKIPFGNQVTDSLGIEALPGGVFVLQPSETESIEVGVLALARSTSRGIFERNRVTARRLSSLMRNSGAPRVVVGQFGTTPFSQLMSVYPQQARMRSLMFGIGLLKTFDMNNPFIALTDSNVFVSTDLVRRGFERIHRSGQTHAALAFRIQRISS
jgi:hypothetical protein